MNFDVVLVLGMHRSGTSALTKGLELFGVNLGVNLLAPTLENPKGYFEDTELVQINDRILAKGCSHWSSIQFLERKFLTGSALEAERIIARRWLQAKVANGKPVGLKDPRLCRTLPFWEPLFAEAGLRVGYVLAHRAPMEVAASLQKRNGFDLPYGVSLWAAYTADALLNLEAKTWTTTGFHQLLENPRRELSRLAEFLGCSWDPESKEVTIYEKEFLDSTLRHHRAAESLPHDLEDYRQMSADLAILCQRKNHSVETQALNSAHAVFKKMAGISRTLFENNQALFHQFADQAKELEKHQKLVGERTTWAQSLDEEVQKTRELFQQEQKLAEERTIWAQSLDKELASSRQAQAVAHLQAEEREKRLKLLEDQINRRDTLEHQLMEVRKQVEAREVARMAELEVVKGEVRESRQLMLKELGDSLAGVKQELEAQKVATAKEAKELGDQLAGLKQELGAQKVATAKGVKELGDFMVELKQELIHELRGLVGGLNERQDQLQLKNLAVMDALRTSLGGRLEKNESNLAEVAKYAEQIQDSVVAPSSYLIPAPFSWYSYLYKMLNIRKPSWLIEKRKSGNLSDKPGFWRRLERSIRKRRKRLVARIGFDREWYLQEYPEVGPSGINPLDHYVRFGIQEGRWKSKKDKERRPNPQKNNGLRGILFGGFKTKLRNIGWRVREYPKLRAQIRLSLKELENTFPFDPWWYQAKYPDVEGSGLFPFKHFVAHGAKVGRLPNRRFAPECYLALHPEVADRGIPAALHFLLQGWKEGRLANWLDRYVENRFDRATRERISTLLDQLLLEVNPADPEASRKQKISKLEGRLVAALGKRTALKGNPKVSIIVPVYNQVAHTLACAISLYESAPATTFELVIADDCSTDETGEIFGRLGPDIRVVRTTGNLGFLRNCNNAAKTARGEFLVFLNNDMVVLPGWLDEMLETFAMFADCGMCGSKLLNLDGTLQEAGGIFWNDGSAWNYGRNQNPNLPEFNYVRRTDYCSGASLCLPMQNWKALQGFDEIYDRAYCEDSDLSFRMREQLGLETYYQPFSEGIHLEGVTSGRDTSQGEKAYQVSNLKSFKARWQKVLQDEHEENGQNIFIAQGKLRSKKNVLIADHYVVQPDRDAGSRTVFQIMQLFLKKGINLVFWPANGAYDPKYTKLLQRVGIYVVYDVENHNPMDTWLKTYGHTLSAYFLNRPHVASKALLSIKNISPSAKIFYYGHDIHHQRLLLEIQNNNATHLQKEYERCKKEEKEIWAKADVILYPSSDEVAYVKKYLNNPAKQNSVRLLPVFCFENFLENKNISSKKRAGIVFVAGFGHRPNVSGGLWFAKNVWPLIQKNHKDVSLHYIGSNPSADILQLRSHGINVTGYVTDSELEFFYENARVSIVPLLIGGGMKGKVAEALRYGVPVVTTSIGAQGFDGCNDCLDVCANAEEMAHCISRLISDDELWKRRSKAGLKLAKDRFSTEAMWRVLCDIA